MTAKFSKRWAKLARVGQKNPLCDEIALQLMLFETPHCVLGHHYNCHPNTYRSEIGVHVWHFAGLTHLLDHCRQIWLPVFEECMKRNIAEIESWLDVEQEIRSRSENASLVTSVSYPRGS
jgi:hypothetical protein